jgi:hypothetical protein
MDAVPLMALLYVGSGQAESVMGQRVHRTGRKKWSINLGPESSLLAAASQLMRAAGFRPV